MKIGENIKLVAEVGCNHQGDFSLAEKMIETAKVCNVDYVKFQKRNCYKAVPKHMWNSPHPCPDNAFGKTYLDHRLALEFSIDQHKELKYICEKTGIKYSCSVWDEDSAREIISLYPDYIKVPSALNNNYDVLNILFNEYKNDVHISLGMATKNEREDLFKFLKPNLDRVVLYWTTSDYPVKFEDLYLLEIQKLKEITPNVGFSGHHLGIAVDIGAIMLGAKWIERHFTLDRTMRGTDQKISLNPTDLKQLRKNIIDLEISMQFKDEGITIEETKNRNKLRVKE